VPFTSMKKRKGARVGRATAPGRIPNRTLAEASFLAQNCRNLADFSAVADF